MGDQWGGEELKITHEFWITKPSGGGDEVPKRAASPEERGAARALTARPMSIG